MNFLRIINTFWFKLILGILFALIFPSLATPAMGLAYAIFWIGLDAIFDKNY